MKGIMTIVVNQIYEKKTICDVYGTRIPDVFLKELQERCNKFRDDHQMDVLSVLIQQIIDIGNFVLLVQVIHHLKVENLDLRCFYGVNIH